MPAPLSLPECSLSPVLAALADGRMQRLKQGSSLTQTGQNTIMKLEAGCAGAVRRVSDGRAQIVNLYVPGDLVGLREAFGLLPRQVDIETLSPEVRIRAKSFDAMAGSLGVELLRDAACKHVREDFDLFADRLTALGRGLAEERYAALLVEVRDRMLRSGTLSEPGLEFQISLTQEQLGDYLGLSTVHVNRTIRKLSGLGVAKRTGFKIRIEDLDALLNLAGAIVRPVKRQSVITS